MTPYEIPLTAEPQSFTIQLSGVLYTMKVRWCEPATSWVLDIADSLGTVIIVGIPLVPGVDLLNQYAYLGIKGSLFVQSQSDQFAIPTFSSLGSDGLLFFVTD